MTRWLIWLIAATWLATGPAHAYEKPLVIFFGGYQSTPADMNAWVTAARRSIYSQGFDFMAVAYPPGTSSAERDAVQTDNVIIDALVSQIKATPDRGFVVVGHSSGGGIAASVVQQAASGRKNVRLIVLDDGIANIFKPPAGFDVARQVECWSAVNGPVASLDRDPTRASCKNYHELTLPSCKTSFCLHFGLVNFGAPPDLSSSTAFVVSPNGTTGGYRNLSLNLYWLFSSLGLGL